MSWRSSFVALVESGDFAVGSVDTGELTRVGKAMLEISLVVVGRHVPLAPHNVVNVLTIRRSIGSVGIAGANTEFGG